MLQDLKPLFASFRSRHVEYLVIGGVAAIAYGVPRLTVDLDIAIRPTVDNARALLAALEEAGFGTASLTTPEEVAGTEVTIFKDRVRIDVQTRTPGIDFDAAYGRRNTVALEGTTADLVSIEDLIASKRAAGRPQDLDDVRLLESQRGGR